MSPSAVSTVTQRHVPLPVTISKPGQLSYLMDRDLNTSPHEVVLAKGNYIELDNGQRVFDATGGAAVSCLGHGNEEAMEAISIQMRQVSYCNSVFFKTKSTSTLAEELIVGTDYKLAKAFLICSGSEAMEAAMKLGRQYFVESGQPQRVKFIGREHSYHGNTLGALSMSGHVARRQIYLPLLSSDIHRVSACNPYRQRLVDETDSEFVSRKAAELDLKFQELGGDTVIGFVCEPISGAALGCVPYLPGYLAAMKKVCIKYGALFILDEVMCGMGRSGTLHAWQAEHSDEPGRNCVPDIQTIGKGLGGGYQPIAAVLVGHKIVKVLKDGSGAFVHGQTYQAFPVSCAAALTVQRIIKRDNLLENVRIQGAYLSTLLHEKLGSHPHVGNIRGMGLFWGIEFVQDRFTKEPFDPKFNVAKRIQQTAISKKWSMSFYNGQGTVDGIQGDHVMIAPAYNITGSDVRLIVDTMEGVVKEVFLALDSETRHILNGARLTGI